MSFRTVRDNSYYSTAEPYLPYIYFSPESNKTALFRMAHRGFGGLSLGLPGSFSWMTDCRLRHSSSSPSYCFGDWSRKRGHGQGRAAPYIFR